jgi:hypothetical protein
MNGKRRKSGKLAAHTDVEREMNASTESKYGRFVHALLQGLGAAAGMCRPVKYPTPAGSDLDRMRGDVTRVGADFNRVIEHNTFDKPQP